MPNKQRNVQQWSIIRYFIVQFIPIIFGTGTKPPAHHFPHVIIFPTLLWNINERRVNFHDESSGDAGKFRRIRLVSFNIEHRRDAYKWFTQWWESWWETSQVLKLVKEDKISRIFFVLIWWILMTTQMSWIWEFCEKINENLIVNCSQLNLKPLKFKSIKLSLKLQLKWHVKSKCKWSSPHIKPPMRMMNENIFPFPITLWMNFIGR